MSKPNLPLLPHYLRKTLDSHQEEYVTAYAEEAVRPYIEALERIASEEFISLGEGNVDVRPTISDREACNLARATLMGVGSPGHKPAPVDTSSGHSSKMVRTLWGLKERYRTRGDDALSVATRAMQMIRRSKLDPFERQQHDKLIQDFAALHERPPKENDHG